MRFKKENNIILVYDYSNVLIGKIENYLFYAYSIEVPIDYKELRDIYIYIDDML